MQSKTADNILGQWNYLTMEQIEFMFLPGGKLLGFFILVRTQKTNKAKKTIRRNIFSHLN
jgi:hypothetical protein